MKKKWKKRILKSYGLNLYELESEDGFVIEIPEDAIYRSVEGKVTEHYDGYGCGSYNSESGLLWMEINTSKPLVKRRFKADWRGEMDIKEYYEFFGVFTIRMDSDWSKTYHIYELTMDPNDVEMKWVKIKTKYDTDYRWKLKHYNLMLHAQSAFGGKPYWELILSRTHGANEYYEIIEDAKTPAIAKRVLA